MDLFLSEDILKEISYTSTLPQSLKTISLRKTPLELILADIDNYRDIYSDKVVFQSNIICFFSIPNILYKATSFLRRFIKKLLI